MYAPLKTGGNTQGQHPFGLSGYAPMDTETALGLSPQLSADLPSLIIDPATGDWWVPPPPQPSPTMNVLPIAALAAAWFFLRKKR